MKRNTVVNTMWQILMVTEAVSARCPAIWMHCIRSIRSTLCLTPLESSQPGSGEDLQRGGGSGCRLFTSCGKQRHPGGRMELTTDGWRSRKNVNSRSDFELFDFVSVEANNSYLVEDIPDLKWLLQPTTPLVLPPWTYQYCE